MRLPINKEDEHVPMSTLRFFRSLKMSRIPSLHDCDREMPMWSGSMGKQFPSMPSFCRRSAPCESLPRSGLVKSACPKNWQVRSIQSLPPNRVQTNQTINATGNPWRCVFSTAKLLSYCFLPYGVETLLLPRLKSKKVLTTKIDFPTTAILKNLHD